MIGSKELLEKIAKCFDDLKHKAYDRRSFKSGYLIGYMTACKEISELNKK